MYIPDKDDQLIKNSQIPTELKFGGIKILNLNDKEVNSNYTNRKYEYLHNLNQFNEIIGILSVLGNTAKDSRRRVVFNAILNLKDFVQIMKYDPSADPIDDFMALGMHESHARTQSDFKGAKAKNKNNYVQYLMEGVQELRTIYLPPISGWQSEVSFKDTIFEAFDVSNKDFYYGKIYLPKHPIMQSDGQTQTAALFGLAGNKEAVSKNALNSITISLEIELNLNEDKAGQSFADRNGRGSKKNANLVKSMDISAALSELRNKSIRDTVFEGRLSDGRSGPGNISETSIINIVDLSTLEQMILISLTGSTQFKPEQVKHFHINKLQPYAYEFLKILSDTFGSYWKNPTPENSDPYRKIYVHSWAFALKAIAMVYFNSRYEELRPISRAMIETPPVSVEDTEEFFQSKIDELQTSEKGPINLGEFKNRLKKICWFRNTKAWIDITGYKKDKKSSRAKTWNSKYFGKEVVKANAQNQAVIISNVASKILNDSWTDLCSEEEFKV